MIIFQARDRLAFLTEEILKIGSNKVTSETELRSEDTVLSLSTEGGEEDPQPSGTSNKDKTDKELEDYPRPLAVVGVSVL